MGRSPSVACRVVQQERLRGVVIREMAKMDGSVGMASGFGRLRLLGAEGGDGLDLGAAKQGTRGRAAGSRGIDAPGFGRFPQTDPRICEKRIKQHGRER